VELSGKHIVVTGGAGGIGRGLLRRFAQEGAGALVVAGPDLVGAEAVAREIGGLVVEFDAASDPERWLKGGAVTVQGPHRRRTAMKASSPAV
jgi:NAD(P)-dependent dehydrogenase (short-subunit alcohol dehydrogenase family)